MARVLLIAGKSFIGTHLRARLDRLGHETTFTTRSGPGLPCDLANSSEVKAVVRETAPQWLIDCAGVTHGDDAAMHRAHVDGTRHLLGAVGRHAPAATVLLFGSAAEYGQQHALPIRENQVCRPLTAYGRSKLAQTQLAHELGVRMGLRLLIVRPFNVIGPGLPEHFMPARLARASCRSGNGTGASGSILVANAHATRDWIDVRDVAAAIVGLLAGGVAAPGRVGLYNIATGIETPVLAIARELCRLAGMVHAVPAGDTGHGIGRSAGDATRLRQATGWAPSISWQRSLADMWAAQRTAANQLAATS